MENHAEDNNDLLKGSDDGDRYDVAEIGNDLNDEMGELQIARRPEDGREMIASAMAYGFSSVIASPDFQIILQNAAEIGAEKAYKTTFAKMKELVQKTDELEEEKTRLENENERLKEELKSTKEENKIKCKQLIKSNKRKIQEINKEKKDLEDELKKKDCTIKQLKSILDKEKCQKQQAICAKNVAERKLRSTKKK